MIVTMNIFDRLLTQPIFNLLALIYNFVADFGVAIIIMTILVRLLLWPLVKKQLHQTKLMRSIQPELKQIKKKTKGNRMLESQMMMELYRERGMEAVLRAIDTDLLGLHASAGTNVSGGATIDDADFLSAVYALDAGEIPQENRSAIVGHKFMNDLRGINKFTAYDQTGKTGLAVSGKANVPNLYGVDIYQSGNVADDTTNTHNLMFHKSGLSLAVQQKPKFHMEESVDVLGTKCAVDAVYGVAIERAAAVVDIERTS